MSPRVFFVYVQGEYGPEPRIWWGDRPRVTTPPVLAKHELTGRAREYTVDQLRGLYPEPKVVVETKQEKPDG